VVREEPGVKRFLIFTGAGYYPEGGWNDFRGSLDDLEAAKTFALAKQEDWAHIIDIETGKEAWHQPTRLELELLEKRVKKKKKKS
jgi:hypothetical protein